MDTVPVTLEGLKKLAEAALENGRPDAFSVIALQWAEGAHDEIFNLMTQVYNLNLEVKSLKTDLEREQAVNTTPYEKRPCGGCLMLRMENNLLQHQVKQLQDLCGKTLKTPEE